MSSKAYFSHDTAVIGEGARIGRGTRVWAFTNIQDGAVIGEECNICDGCFVEKGAAVGNHVTVKNNVALFEGVTLEDGVFCGAQAVFINDRRPRSRRETPWTLEKVLVRRGATVGSNATVLCGVTVGEYAVVGAGSVVTKDVPAYTVVRGNPAVPAGYACQCGQRLDERMVCPCGRRYTISGGFVQPEVAS